MATIKTGGKYSPVGSAVFSRHYGCSVGNRAVLSLLQYKFTAETEAPSINDMQQQHTAAKL
jgi:hypothetical protein